jgi:hypothetical protein
MKALITAFALLSFVAASTVPMVAQAADKTEQPTKAKTKKAKKPSSSKKTSATKSPKKTTKKASKST